MENEEYLIEAGIIPESIGKLMKTDAEGREKPYGVTPQWAFEPTGNSDRPWLRLIGDVHGLHSQYTGIANKAEYSICLGDVGFEYSWIAKNLDPEKHKILAGNHDNYEEWEGRFIMQTAHFLGDYGVYTVPGFGDLFYVRGGNSIDKAYRKEGRDWWAKEELSYSQGMSALELYKQTKPRFVISHECPTSVIEFVSGIRLWDGVPIRPSMTANLLQSMFEAHQPEWWVFGHHHKDRSLKINGTAFRCLAELSYIDFEKNKEE